MKEWRSLILSLLVVGAVILVPYCAYQAVFGPNTRFFKKGTMVAQGRLSRTDAHFNVLSFGDWRRPYDGSPAFQIRLLDDRVLAFPLDPGFDLAPYSDKTRDATANWPPGTLEYLLPECNIIVLDGAVQQVDVITFDAKSQFQIKTDKVTNWYPLPLTDEAMVELFGHADRSWDIFVH